MNNSSVILFFGSLIFVLGGVGWLLFKLIAHLRQSALRYRWFELFTCLFLVSWGFLILLRVPKSEWSVWWACFAGGSILTGATNLGIVLRERFGGPGTLRCSFCNRSQCDVKKLIAGSRVYICDECVEICLTIINEDKQQPDPGGAPTGTPIPQPTQ